MLDLVRDPAAGQSAPQADRPEVLLTMAGYGGTLAAARCLGGAGIGVTVAFDHAGQPAAWSRWTSRRVRCPSFRDPQRFVDWLLEFGSRERLHVLYPTCDDLCFLFARHEAELSRCFLLYQPKVEVLLALLDKKSLHAAARRAGLEVPITYVPDDDQALERVAREARFPLLIKPRTQLMFRTQNKGIRVQRREDLVEAYHGYLRAHTYLPALLAARPEVARPMLQEYVGEAEEGILSVAGFVDRTGKLFVARASRKVLQQPRRVGVGVCFEAAHLDPAMAERIVALCREVGYFGVFEMEFICAGGRRLLIDFNPRYYNQMGFEIARGLPLPMLVYAAARGDEVGLERAVQAARSQEDPHGAAYCHRFVFHMMVGAQRLSGRMGADDFQRWRTWYGKHRESATDAAFDHEDRLPGFLDAVLQLRRAARHPRGFFRSIVLNQ